MNNDPSSMSWLERLGHAISRPKNQGELLVWLRDIAEHHLIERDALRMMEGVLQVANMQVRDVMIPRSQMVVLNADTPLKDILPTVINSAHSRYPVIKENLDEVMGILLAKDLLAYNVQNPESFNIQNLLRPATFIPESKRLNVLLQEFRISRNHMAIVVDEYGGVSGLLTIEDVLEEIVGEIEDEYDIEEGQSNISKIGDEQFIVKALTPISEFNDYFKIQLNDEEFDTIGGLVVHHFSYVPKRNETIVINGFDFKILHADKRMIRLLQVTLPATE